MSQVDTSVSERSSIFYITWAKLVQDSFAKILIDNLQIYAL